MRPLKSCGMQSEKLTLRAGSMMVLVSAMLFVFIVAAMLTVDVAYMQLVRSELRVATDAAAKAAAESLARTESQGQARQAAKHYAEMNQVAGNPFLIGDNDITFGRVSANEEGGWDFSANATPANSVRVEGRLANDARTKAVPLFFAPSLGHGPFATAASAVASQQEVEVALCLDRSGSMLFDMSGNSYSFPSGHPNLSPWSYWGTTWRYMLSPPHPTGSRWAILSEAVDLFLAEAGSFDPPPRTSLVTWGSDYTMPISPRTEYLEATTDFALPAPESPNWALNVSGIQAALDVLTAAPMMGGTNLSAGLDRGVQVLTGPNTRSLSNKVIILMTDGQWNYGRDPIAAAQDAYAAGITVHTITMLSSDQATMAQIAQITGGQHYNATSEVELRTAFSEIARSLPVVLTE